MSAMSDRRKSLPKKISAQKKTSPTPRRKSASYDKKTIALVYDFDCTLSPKPMQEYTFLPTIGQNPKTFWKEVGEEARKHEADLLLTYMRLMYKKAKEAGIEIRRNDLRDLGSKVELFKGVDKWFDAINSYVSEKAGSSVKVRHYLISSGLKDIIEGTSIYKQFHNVFAAEYFFEAYDLPFPKRVITDTCKTQYLFRINKGIEDLNQSINSHMAEDNRPIPFANMIYFGDGDTDVPSMTVTRKNGGHAVAVYPPKAKRNKCVELFKADRVDFFAPADFSKGQDLFRRTCILLDHIVAGIKIEEERWRLSRESRAPAKPRSQKAKT